MGINRSRRVADLLREELSFAIKRSLKDPRLAGLSITSVDVSPDLRNAKVYYTLMTRPHSKEVDVALAKASGFLRHFIADKTDLRYTPKLQFIFDDTSQRAYEINSLINSVLSDEESSAEEDSNDESTS